MILCIYSLEVCSRRLRRPSLMWRGSATLVIVWPTHDYCDGAAGALIAIRRDNTTAVSPRLGRYISAYVRKTYYNDTWCAANRIRSRSTYLVLSRSLKRFFFRFFFPINTTEKRNRKTRWLLFNVASRYSTSWSAPRLQSFCPRRDRGKSYERNRSDGNRSEARFSRNLISVFTSATSTRVVTTVSFIADDSCRLIGDRKRYVQPVRRSV